MDALDHLRNARATLWLACAMCGVTSGVGGGLFGVGCTADAAPAEADGVGAGAGSGGAAGTAGAVSTGGIGGAGGASGGASGGTSGTAGARAGTGGAGGASGASGGEGGASAGSGGASGAGGTPVIDAGLDGGGGTGEVDPCDSALFCDDFESYAAGAPPGGEWQAQTNHGAINVVEDQRFSGSKAARFTTEQSSGGKTAFIRLDDAKVFPVQGNAYFGRIMFRLESAPEESVHWTFIQSGGGVPGESYHALYRYGGQHPVSASGSFVGNQLMANYDTPDSYGGNGPSSDCWLHADETVVPVGRWACAEWQFDGANDTMRLWLDGVPLDDLTMTGLGQGCVHQSASYPWTAPTFGDVSIGWESYQSDAARTLYVDDVVISAEKIGCP